MSNTFCAGAQPAEISTVEEAAFGRSVQPDGSASPAKTCNKLTGWVAHNLGWFYIAAVSALLVFLLGLAVQVLNLMEITVISENPEAASSSEISAPVYGSNCSN